LNNCSLGYLSITKSMSISCADSSEKDTFTTVGVASIGKL